MRLLLLVCIAWMVAACGGGGGGDAAPAEPVPDPPQDLVCSVSSQRSSLRSYMEQSYYFAPAAGNSQAATIDAYFQSLLARPQDRYSYSEPAAGTLLGVQGQRIGFGYTVAWADDARTVMKVRNVEPGSPVERAGLRRGDVVLAVDGRSPAQIAAGDPPPVTQAGVAREFQTRDGMGQTRSFTVSSALFTQTAVPATGTFTVQRQSQPVVVGYLVLQQFATFGYLEIGAAFRSLAAQGVQELVVDLRYNGGGSVNLSRDVASLVAGSRAAGQVYANLRYNERNAASNLSLPFLTRAETLPAAPLQGLSRVVVIASAATASASEAFINGLKPVMPVVLVGDTTFGKPYGFVAREACGTTFNAVNFELTNAQGAGGYTAGFAPDCSVADDLERQLGDPQEGRLHAALYFLANGRCEAAQPQRSALASRAMPRAFGEVLPPGMTLD
jgi:C-terminal processing protease CtpA/Prc